MTNIEEKLLKLIEKNPSVWYKIYVIECDYRNTIYYIKEYCDLTLKIIKSYNTRYNSIIYEINYGDDTEYTNKEFYNKVQDILDISIERVIDRELLELLR